MTAPGVGRGWSRRLSRVGWDLARFGLSPGKIGVRLRPSGAPRVLCVSLPKAGTHLVERALCLHPRLYRTLKPTLNDRNLESHGGLEHLLSRLRPGQLLLAHLGHTPEREEALRRAGVRSIFVVRDPRDILVSQVHYVARERNHTYHQLFNSRGSLEERLSLAIEGSPEVGLESAAERLRRYAGWLESGSPVVRFEELIGPEGGGREDRQLEALARLYDEAGLEASPEWIRWAGRRLFSGASPTFRRGVIGQGRQYFEGTELERRFLESADDLLAVYGYGEAARSGRPA